MEKVIISEEVAEAIKTILLLNGGDKTDTLSGFKCWKGKLKGSDLKPLNNISEETLALALFVGYEVEQSPAEMVADYYARAKREDDGSIYNSYACAYAKGRKEGVEFVAKAYGIKIEGVNV